MERGRLAKQGTQGFGGISSEEDDDVQQAVDVALWRLAFWVCKTCGPPQRALTHVLHSQSSALWNQTSQPCELRYLQCYLLGRALAGSWILDPAQEFDEKYTSSSKFTIHTVFAYLEMAALLDPGITAARLLDTWQHLLKHGIGAVGAPPTDPHRIDGADSYDSAALRSYDEMKKMYDPEITAQCLLLIWAGDVMDQIDPGNGFQKLVKSPQLDDCNASFPSDNELAELIESLQFDDLEQSPQCSPGSHSVGQKRRGKSIPSPGRRAGPQPHDDLDWARPGHSRNNSFRQPLASKLKRQQGGGYSMPPSSRTQNSPASSPSPSLRPDINESWQGSVTPSSNRTPKPPPEGNAQWPRLSPLPSPWTDDEQSPGSQFKDQWEESPQANSKYVVSYGSHGQPFVVRMPTSHRSHGGSPEMSNVNPQPPPSSEQRQKWKPIPLPEPWPEDSLSSTKNPSPPPSPQSKQQQQRWKPIPLPDPWPEEFISSPRDASPSHKLEEPISPPKNPGPAMGPPALPSSTVVMPEVRPTEHEKLVPQLPAFESDQMEQIEKGPRQKEDVSQEPPKTPRHKEDVSQEPPKTPDKSKWALVREETRAKHMVAGINDAKDILAKELYTKADATMFQMPVSRIGVSGGTAPFFNLILRTPGDDQAQCHYIGKDLERAMDELVFYEELVFARQNPPSSGIAPLLDFMFDYAGLVRAPEKGVGKIRNLMVLGNLHAGYKCMRMLDIKLGTTTAVAGWYGKTKYDAWRQKVLDSMTNSTEEGYRVEGFEQPPPSLTSMEPLPDMKFNNQATTTLAKKALRLMLQRMNAVQMFMYFLDVHQQPADPGETLSTLFPIEVAELLLHEFVIQLCRLSVACERVQIPQKWIGSSVALCFDCAWLPDRDMPESDIRGTARVKLFDWGKSEMNTADKQKDLSSVAKMDRVTFWKSYVTAVHRLAWEATRAYWNRFGCATGWADMLVTVCAYKSGQSNDLLGSAALPIAPTSPDGNVVELSDAEGNSITGCELAYSIQFRQFPTGARLLGSLRVTLLGAVNLPLIRGVIGREKRWNPFAIVTAFSKHDNLMFQQQTRVASNTLNPEWSETFDLPVSSDPHHVEDALRLAGIEVPTHTLSSLFSAANNGGLTHWPDIVKQASAPYSMRKTRVSDFLG